METRTGTCHCGAVRYRWNSRPARHYFCSSCGIYTHRQRRSNPLQCGFTVACIEGIDPFALGPIVGGDGAAQSLVTP